MKKHLKRTAAVLVSFLLMLSVVSVAFAADSGSSTDLKFNDDGKFTVLQFTDCQDLAMTTMDMLSFMKAAIRDSDPDLVIFTGDNAVQSGTLTNRIALENIVDPLISGGNVPYYFTFGNHDSHHVSKQAMTKTFDNYGNCLNDSDLSRVFDAESGSYATCYAPILSSDGSHVAFNLWIIDSNSDSPTGGYDKVHDDQLDWYVENSNALKAANGGEPVKSLVFQHIIVPEAWGLLNKPGTTAGAQTVSYGGTDYELTLNQSYLKGDFNVLMEGFGSASPETVGDPYYDEYHVMARQGDVEGIVTGHDHVNCFVANLNDGSGIDFIQSPTCGFSSSGYGDDADRGARVFTIDENTGSYETHVIRTVSYGFTGSNYNDPASEAQYKKDHALEYAEIVFYDLFRAFVWLVDDMQSLLNVAGQLRG